MMRVEMRRNEELLDGCMLGKVSAYIVREVSGVRVLYAHRNWYKSQRYNFTLTHMSDVKAKHKTMWGQRNKYIKKLGC